MCLPLQLDPRISFKTEISLMQIIQKRLTIISLLILNRISIVAQIPMFYSRKIPFKMRISNFLARKQIWLSTLI